MCSLNFNKLVRWHSEKAAILHTAIKSVQEYPVSVTASSIFPEMIIIYLDYDYIHHICIHI